jgi:hypothetical protein
MPKPKSLLPRFFSSLLKKTRSVLAWRMKSRVLALMAYAWFSMIVVAGVASFLDNTPSPRERTATEPKSIFANLEKGTEAEVVKAIFESKVDLLSASTASLRQNMILQVVFVIFGFLALTGHAKVFELPVINMKLPLSWVRYLIPAILGFLWLQFGFLLDDIINTRSDAFVLLGFSPDLRASELSQVSLAAMVANRLNESGFVDAWFLLFRSDHLIDASRRSLIGPIFAGTFGCLLGITHAMIVAMVARANISYAPQIATLRWLSRIAIAASPFALLGALFLSNFLFYRGGDNPNWFQAVIAGFAFFGTLIIDQLNDSPDCGNAGFIKEGE